MSVNIMITQLLIVSNSYYSYALHRPDIMDRDNSREYGYICISDINYFNYNYNYIPQIFIDFFKYLI